MTEDDARRWIAHHFGDPAVDRLERFVGLVLAESDEQNLIARSTFSEIWVRHVLDSAQLLALAPDRLGLWLDVGTGGGFPGIVVGLLRAGPLLMVEPRRKRAEFLQRAVIELGIDNATVRHASVQHVSERATLISARAVASIEALIAMTAQCADKETVWLLPRGSYDERQIATARSLKGMMFHVKQSLTSDESVILIGHRQ